MGRSHPIQTDEALRSSFKSPFDPFLGVLAQCFLRRVPLWIRITNRCLLEQEQLCVVTPTKLAKRQVNPDRYPLPQGKLAIQTARDELGDVPTGG